MPTKAQRLPCKITSAKKNNRSKKKNKKKTATTAPAIIPILGAVPITAINASNPVLLKNIPPPATRATTILVRQRNYHHPATAAAIPALHENTHPQATIPVPQRKVQVLRHSITLQKAKT